jgi:ribonuclease D
VIPQEESTEYSLAKTQADLAGVVRCLEKESCIGVDLEGSSLHHFEDRISLLQFSTPSHHFLVDALALSDMTPLSRIFKATAIRKVFHGADYDVRCLQRDYGIRVVGLFDTQIAARFMGAKATGLDSLLEEYLGVRLDKKYQKKDWSQRPLPPPMIVYAVRDSQHLITLGKMLQKELRAKGRLSWVEEECRILAALDYRTHQDTPLFHRFKGAGKLQPRTLTVLEAVLRLREKFAREKDKPPFKIFGNESARAIAEKKPRTQGDLRQIPGLSERQCARFGDALVRTVVEAAELPESRLLKYPFKKRDRLAQDVKRRLKALKKWRERRAAELGVEPFVVFTNSQLESIAQAFPREAGALRELSSIRTWQEKAFGGELCAVLNEGK